MKTVPIAAEKRFIELDKKKAMLDLKHEQAKRKLLAYYERGYTFKLVQPSDVSGGVFCPPWKKIALELVAKLYKTEKKRQEFFRDLAKRFPRVLRAPSFSYQGKPKKKEMLEEVV